MQRHAERGALLSNQDVNNWRPKYGAEAKSNDHALAETVGLGVKP